MRRERRTSREGVVERFVYLIQVMQNIVVRRQISRNGNHEEIEYIMKDVIKKWK
jgi:hypothetical protein